MFFMYILYILLVLFITKNCHGQNRDDPILYFSSQELSRLMHYQDQVCAFSPNKDDHRKYDPWFCVEVCAEHAQTRIPIKKTLDCDKFDQKEVPQRTCCFMGNVHIPSEMRPGTTKPAFTAYEHHWGLAQPFKESFVDYSKKLLNDVYHTDIRASMLNNTVCGLQPVNRDVKGDILYVPYICWHMDCTLSMHSQFRSPETFVGGQAQEPDSLDEGAQFCAHEHPFNIYCCHPAVAADIKRVAEFGQYNWATKVLDPRQQYAFGFRSSFQCEQYSRLTCEGNKDRCSQRILDRSIPVPGEFPHQALIGVQSPMMRLFFCNGALVSKYFILSAAECTMYKTLEKREPGREIAYASVALLGEYDTSQVGEFGQLETITFLTEIYEEPYKFAKPHLALFRMWRAINFHYWLRPACINWKNHGFIQPPFPRILENVTFSGYGVNHTGGRWNGTIKRFNVFAAQIPNRCKDVLIEEEAETFCAVKYPTKLPTPWGPCEFDMGGPASAMTRQDSPYCTFKVVGVAMSGPKDCNSTAGITFKDVNSVLVWIEDVVWGLDMNLFDFNVSTPSCDSLQGREERFIDMIHVKDL